MEFLVFDAVDDIVKSWHIITQPRSSEPDGFVLQTAIKLEFKDTELCAVLHLVGVCSPLIGPSWEHHVTVNLVFKTQVAILSFLELKGARQLMAHRPAIERRVALAARPPIWHRRFCKLLAAIDAVLVSVHPRSGMRLFAALLGRDPFIDNLAAAGTETHRRISFSMVKVGAGFDVHRNSRRTGSRTEFRVALIWCIRLAKPMNASRRERRQISENKRRCDN